MLESLKPKGAEAVPSNLPEDQVLHRLHQCTNGERDCSSKEAETIHNDFAKCESFAMYEAYRSGTVPTLHQFENTINAALARAPHDIQDDPEAKKVIHLMQGRPRAIAGNVRSYARTVLRFVQMKQSGAEFRDPEAFVTVDRDRRRAHDNLLKSLSDMHALIAQARDWDICSDANIYTWFPGNTEKIPADRIPLFSKQATDNRDLIRNWALAADFAEHYSKLVEILEAKEH